VLAAECPSRARHAARSCLSARDLTCLAAQIGDPVDVKFLHQVVYGCQRYKRLLKVFLSSFYYNHSGEAARSDISLYTVLAYLAILRLDELTFDQFKRLVLSQDFVKTRVFLKFLFNEESLSKWLKEGWLTLYEPHYVQTELIDEVLKFEPQVRELVAELDRRQAMGEAKRAAEAEAASALAEGRGGSGKHTIPEPFNLTRPAPRLVPEPTQFVQIAPAAAVNSADGEFKARAWTRPDPDEVPKDQQALDRRREANRLELRRKYADPSAGRFELLAEKRPTHLEAARAEQEAKIAAAHTFAPAPPKPVPKWDADQGLVKLNAAAILREDQIYRRKQEKEAALLKAYEEDLADSKPYDEWVRKSRAEEDARAAAALERRRIEATLADEVAKAATEASRLEKRALAQRMRAEAEQLAEEHERQNLLLIERKREQVAAVDETKRNGALAVAEAERKRREAAEAVREESKALEAERKRALAEEDERRQEVIRQIRALEMVPRKRTSLFDPTFEPGHGLLEEMSLAELRERLALAKAREVQERESRRAEIIRSKQDHEHELASKMASISQYRRMGAAQAQDERARAKAQRADKAEAEQRRREEATLKLEQARTQLRAKGRAAEAALAAELREISFKNQYLGTGREAVEASKFESLESGARREAAALQQAAKDGALRKGEIRAREVRASSDRWRCARGRVARGVGAVTRCARAQASARAVCAPNLRATTAHRFCSISTRRPLCSLRAAAAQLSQREKLKAMAHQSKADSLANQHLRFTNSAFDASLAHRQAAEKTAQAAQNERANKARVRAAYLETYPFTDGAGTAGAPLPRATAICQARARARDSRAPWCSHACPCACVPRSSCDADRAQPSTASDGRRRARCARRRRRRPSGGGRARPAPPCGRSAHSGEHSPSLEARTAVACGWATRDRASAVRSCREGRWTGSTRARAARPRARAQLSPSASCDDDRHARLLVLLPFIAGCLGDW
jgi:hypothetical protein